MSRSIALDAAASVVLDGRGDGIASIGPQAPGEVWTSVTVAVSASSNSNEATCKIYTGGQVSPGSFADGTTWGSTGDSSSNIPVPVYPGEEVIASWTGGDPGAVATLRVTGTRSVPG